MLRLALIASLILITSNHLLYNSERKIGKNFEKLIKIEFVLYAEEHKVETFTEIQSRILAEVWNISGKIKETDIFNESKSHD